jgi:GNAT superfamily N-acetyltransferase
MTATAWHEEPVSRKHDRDAFDCGEIALSDFLKRHARKSHELGGAKTFLAIDDNDGTTILGFYSLSPASIEYARTPEIVRRGLGRYEVPAFRLARLAVDLKAQGRGLGGQLLLAAGRRCLLAASQVGGVAMLIDAKTSRVAEWYESYGALRLLDAPLSLVLPLATVAAVLAGSSRRSNRTRE